MKLNTHLKIDTSLCGKVTTLKENYAQVILHTTQQMSADTKGLVHGGFIFGGADYSAMCTVNDPYVVLGASSCKFIAPVKVGSVIVFESTVISQKGKKAEVKVEAFVEQSLVFEGNFTTFVLPNHVLNT